MKKFDGRKIGHEAMAEIRIRAVKQVQSGKSPEDVIDALGMSRSCIYDWLSRYRSGGWDALRAKTLAGRPRILDGRQMQWICRTIAGKNPLQMRLPFALWTLKLVQAVINEKFGVFLSKASVWRLLQQLGLSAQRPLFKAFQQDPKKVDEWVKRRYPAIKRMAKRVGARIFFGDEAGVRSDFHAGTTWAPVGETPVIRATGARFSLNMISAVDNRGELRFMVVDGTVNAHVFIEFLNRLLVNADRPIFLIVDGHPSHRAKCVTDFVKSTNGMLGLFFLPGYSPELNPDEFVWNDLKNRVVGRKSPRDKQEMKKMIIGGLRSLQRRPDKVRSFFAAKDTKYAA